MFFKNDENNFCYKFVTFVDLTFAKSCLKKNVRKSDQV